jgi:CheY-like chemotaxis protein
VKAAAADVLIIEDDSEMREMLEHLLRSEGYAVRTATDGGEALTRMREAPVRLVLLDLLLPAMNGYEFRKAQLRDDRLAEIPVVLVSGAANLHIAAARMRIRDYLVKPLDLNKLLQTVRDYLS